MELYLEQKTDSILGINVKKAEEQYNAKFVGDFALKGKRGWNEHPAAIFWQENPPIINNKQCSNYFGLTTRHTPIGTQVYIMDGSSAFSEPITGVVANDGQVIYSGFRHDYRASKDGSVSIDGGRDYLKIGGKVDADLRTIRVNGPKLELEPEDVGTTGYERLHVLAGQAGLTYAEGKFSGHEGNLLDFAHLVSQADRLGTLSVLEEMKVWDHLQGDYQHVIEAITDEELEL